MVKLKPKRALSLVLRLLAVGASLSAAVVMATSRERASIFSISFEAKYSDVPAFKYFVIANSIASVYGFLVIFLPPESMLWRLVVVLDLIITLLLTSSMSAALAIAQVGKHGNSHAGWLPICGQVPKYCERTAGALAANFAAVIFYVLLLLWSIHSVTNPFLV